MWCFLIFKSQHVIDVGMKTISCCFSTTLVWLQNKNQNDKDNAFLDHLNERVRLQAPHFTAAKFYTVDLATFFVIINMMASYIVVVVQFATDT